ncbi:MAG: hypothetical protein AAB225_31390 [Acidobacteriota bacterium]
MSALFGEKVTLAQANGPGVELVVWGDEWYATYETLSGYSAVYDDELGLFCYARVAGGQFESTKVAVSESPPAGAEAHARESDAVRMAKVTELEARRASRGPTGVDT